MGGPGGRLGRVHGLGEERLHGQRSVAGEGIVVLHVRLVLRVVGGILRPGGGVVLEGVLVVGVRVVMLLVVHVQLAHGEQAEQQTDAGRGGVRAAAGAAVVLVEQTGSQGGHLRLCRLMGIRGGVGSLRRMHAWRGFLRRRDGEDMPAGDAGSSAAAQTEAGRRHSGAVQRAEEQC